MNTQKRNAFLESLHFNISDSIEVYGTYATGEYKEQFKKTTLAQHMAIKQKFPELNFYTTSRIKSMSATLKKSEDKGIDRVYDIHGVKHVLVDVKGNNDENLLIQYCYRIEEFLKDFFASCDIDLIERRRKDYIASPKETNYQALHFTCQDIRN